MRRNTEIDNSRDIIDSRDVMERLYSVTIPHDQPHDTRRATDTAAGEEHAMTRGSNERPTRRLLRSERFGDEYVIELRADLILMRPKGARRNGRAEIAVTPGAIYQRALEVRVDAERRANAKARKAGRR